MKRLYGLGLRALPHTELLRLLNLQSLEVRRLHFNLILCYRIVFGLVSVNKDEFFFQLNNARTIEVTPTSCTATSTNPLATGEHRRFSLALD